MSEKQKKEINQQLYEKFFIELKKKHNIDKETFYNSEFYQSNFKELDECIDTIKCTCEVKIKKVNILRSDILDKEIIIGSECLNNFLIDDENDFLKNTFNKKCSLCYNINIGKNHQICNDCQKRKKCTKCKMHIPKLPFKICTFCTFNQKPMNDGNYIIGKYGDIPIYINYGKFGPYLEWLKYKISIPKYFIKFNNISLDSAIQLIKLKVQQPF